MTTNPPPYMPEQGSLAERVQAFFLRNPDDELSRGDIALKFEVQVADVARLLKPLLDDHTLLFVRPSGKGAPIYKAGLALSEAAKKQGNLELDKPTNPARPAALPTLAKPRKTRSPQVPVTMDDIDALKVDGHVPPTLPRYGGQRKWAPLFAKLLEKGQSVEFPSAWKTAVGAEAQKLNARNRKSDSPARYKVAMTLPGKARAWRIA